MAGPFRPMEVLHESAPAAPQSAQRLPQRQRGQHGLGDGAVRLTTEATDLAWLEHSLLFMFKTPAEFGAKLWNGVYFQLKATERGLEGSPQAVDLNRISAPPAQPGVPPFRPALRDDIAPGARWFNRLTIE